MHRISGKIYAARSTGASASVTWWPRVVVATARMDLGAVRHNNAVHGAVETLEQSSDHYHRPKHGAARFGSGLR